MGVWSISAGSASRVSGTGAAIGAVSAGAGSVVMVASQGPVRVPVPGPLPAAKPGQLVLGGFLVNRHRFSGVRSWLSWVGCVIWMGGWWCVR